LEDFLAEPFTDRLELGFETAERFGVIAVALRRKGRPIPTNNIWIAAHVMEAGAELLSYGKDFEAVEGLSWTRLTAQS
jgi:predicted nucleic acid-binding protein